MMDQETRFVDRFEIKDRQENTRSINEAFVETRLKPSLLEHGLFSPLVVDSGNRLLAGLHRLAAIRALPEDIYREKFPRGVPVVEMQVADDLDRLIVEVTENRQRLEYTREEICGVREKLIAAGYHDGHGRPPAGKRAVTPAIAALLQVSPRTIKRAVADTKKVTPVTLSEPKADGDEDSGHPADKPTNAADVDQGQLDFDQAPTRLAKQGSTETPDFPGSDAMEFKLTLTLPERLADRYIAARKSQKWKVLEKLLNDDMAKALDAFLTRHTL